MRRWSRILEICILLAVLWAGASSPAGAADAVLVQSSIKTKAARLYTQAIKGFTENFPGSTEVVALEKGADGDSLNEAIRKHRPSVVVIVGAAAGKMLQGKLQDLPHVFCMIPESLQKKYSNAQSHGVLMQPTPNDQLKAFKRLLPKKKKIGVIYSKKKSGKFVKSARKAAQNLGLSLVEATVEDNKEVMNALKQVLEEADSLWLLRDRKVVNLSFFTLVLQVQVEKKIPVFVYSDKFVHKGALCSYSASYHDQGVQAAKMARAITEQKDLSSNRFQTPNGTLVINSKTAARLGLDTPASLLESPDVKTVSN